MPIEMSIVSHHVELLDVEELSSCEMPVRTKIKTDKPVQSPFEPKLRIEIDPPEHQLEPEYFLEKWPPEHCQLLNRLSMQFKPDNSSIQNAPQVKETTV